MEKPPGVFFSVTGKRDGIGTSLVPRIPGGRLPEE